VGVVVSPILIKVGVELAVPHDVRLRLVEVVLIDFLLDGGRLLRAG
jgi:hypothetical protein